MDVSEAGVFFPGFSDFPCFIVINPSPYVNFSEFGWFCVCGDEDKAGAGLVLSDGDGVVCGVADASDFDVCAYVGEVFVVVVFGGVPDVCVPVAVGGFGDGEFADGCCEGCGAVVLHVFFFVVFGVFFTPVGCEALCSDGGCVGVFPGLYFYDHFFFFFLVLLLCLRSQRITL